MRAEQKVMLAVRRSKVREAGGAHEKRRWSLRRRCRRGGRADKKEETKAARGKKINQ